VRGSELIAEGLGLVQRDLAVELPIGFVASDNQEDVLVVCVFSEFLNPLPNSIKAFSVRDVVNKNRTVSISVVIPG